MEPQPTAEPAPIHIRIADDFRMKIERGDLKPGDQLPTLAEIADQWRCGMNSARSAVALLKQMGLVSGGRGKAPQVRTPMARVCRSSDRHQAEKDLVLKSEEERRRTGVAETDLGTAIAHLDFTATYETVSAEADIARALNIESADKVLRRVYEMKEPRDGVRRAYSISYIPYGLVEDEPALLDSSREPWPGGTQHQLSTIGIEILKVVDQVSATMPTTAEAALWDLDEGVPMLNVRRVSYDTTGQIVEVSDAEFPADRTELSFTTYLEKW
jgi:GntR family transcriptional regulator